MSGRLEGKTALITAAGQGIGYATAVAMAREGAQVYATDVNPVLLEKYSGVVHVAPRVLDVLDDGAIAKLTGELPPLDILFNCAGYVHNGTILDCSSVEAALASTCELLGSDTAGVLTRIDELRYDQRTSRPQEDELMSWVTSWRPAGVTSAVRWFHATRVVPGTTFSEGLLPTSAALPNSPS